MLTPFLTNSAANSNVSEFVPSCLNPPVSVIIPVIMHVPSSFVIFILKYSAIPANISQHAGETGFT